MRMKIGTTLYLDIENPNTKEIIEYQSKVIEKSESYLFIDFPIHMNTRKTSFFPIGTEFIASYLKDETNLYSFKAKIKRRINSTIPALAITLPEQESIGVIQRRRFVRIKTALDIAVHCPNDSFPPFTTLSVDISGGGLSFIIPPGINIEIDKDIFVWIVLPMRSGVNEYAKADATVVRTKHLENNTKKASIKFIAISNKDEQNIVKYCFEKQREERMRSLI